jgi:Flp pilus assembly protein TadD/TolB-like protein
MTGFAAGPALLLALSGQAGSAAPAKPEAARILVVPFQTPGRDGRTYWLGEAVAVLIADDVNARGLGAITRPSRERAYDQLHLPPNAVLSRATVIKVGELVGAGQVIVGEVGVDGDVLTVRARPIRIDVGRAQGEIIERGSLGDLFALVQKVAGRVVPGGSTAVDPSRASGSPRAESRGDRAQGRPAAAASPSLQAFEQYVKGILAQQPATEAAFLEAALKLDPAYDRARLALWEVRTSQGDHAGALAAARAVSPSSPDAHRARFLAGVSLMAQEHYDEAFTIFKSLQDTAPDPAILNNLGVIQLRRAAQADAGKPAYYFTKATETAPDDPDLLFNLGYAYAVDRDPQGAIYWLREALRRNPTDGEAHVVLAAALDAAGSTVEADRERELAAQLSPRPAEPPGKKGEPLPRGLERERHDLDSMRGSAIDQAIANTAQRDQRDLAQFHLERGRRLYQAEQDRDAMMELRRAVFLSPYEAEAHLLIGRIHLRAGRPREAADALKISIWSRDTAPAHVALADAYLRLNDVPGARVQVQKALALDPSSAEAKALLERIERGPGHPVGATFRSRVLDRAGC